jgi:heme/copper-type cytochrome/quinol oxidase subunit 3
VVVISSSLAISETVKNSFSIPYNLRFSANKDQVKIVEMYEHFDILLFIWIVIFCKFYKISRKFHCVSGHDNMPGIDLL